MRPAYAAAGSVSPAQITLRVSFLFLKTLRKLLEQLENSARNAHKNLCKPR